MRAKRHNVFTLPPQDQPYVPTAQGPLNGKRASAAYIIQMDMQMDMHFNNIYIYMVYVYIYTYIYISPIPGRSHIVKWIELAD